MRHLLRADGTFIETDLFWTLRGTYAERKKTLEKMTAKYLRAAILDSEYNKFLRNCCNVNEYDKDRTRIRHGKRVPYVGWFWRHLEFHKGRLPIGFIGRAPPAPRLPTPRSWRSVVRDRPGRGGYVGFMANNKWGHHERLTTPEEFDTIMGFIDAAMAESQKGGELEEMVRKTHAELKKLRDYVQTLPLVP